MNKKRRNVKPIYQLEKELFLAYRKGKIIVYNTKNGSISYSLRVPMNPWKKILSMFRITTRILRLEPSEGAKIMNTIYLFSMSGGIYFYDLQTKTIKLEHKFKKGMRNPLRITELENVQGFTDGIYYGEYSFNKELKDVSIFMRSFKIKGQWEKVYTFQGKKINHIHAIIPDKYRKCLWILTGDTDEGSGIWMAKENFHIVKPLLIGKQQYRACALAVYENYLVFCTDTPLEDNAMYLISDIKEDEELTCVIDKVKDLPGPCIYSTMAGQYFVFSTSVEPDPCMKRKRYLLTRKIGKGVKDRYVHLFCVDKLLNIHEIAAEKKDLLPMGLFQFRTIQFPKQKEQEKVYCYFNSTVRYEGQWLEYQIKFGNNMLGESQNYEEEDCRD